MIPPEWLQNRGKGSTVGIIDTGLEASLSCFKSPQITYKEFGATSKRHGTHIVSTILDFAPEVEVIFAGGILESYAKLEEMIDWISKFDLDVLNLSFTFRDKDESILEKLQKISSKGTLVVCSHATKALYPWSISEFINAGKNGEFKAPEEWTTYSSTGYRTLMKGSSTSAAITSGLCCLGKAINPEMNKEEFLSMIDPEDIPKYETPKRQKILKL